MNPFENEAPDHLFSLRMPMIESFGLRGLSISEFKVQVRMPPHPAHTNSRGDVHGGAMAVLMDCALSAAARAHAPTAFGVVTVDLSTHYLASTKGEVIATATCERRGRGLCFVRGEAHDSEGQLLALATGTFKLVEGRSPT